MRRWQINQNGKRRGVVVACEEGGETTAKVFNSKAAGVAPIAAKIGLCSTVYADEATHWDVLHDKFLTKRINHEWAYSDEGACTNDAESYFSRLRRAEVGIHHHIAGDYFEAYGAKMALREDNRRVSNGEQYLKSRDVALAHPVSRTSKGYWQR